MRLTSLLEHVLYPRTDTISSAQRAVWNGAIAGWIMVAVHFMLGAVLIIFLAQQPSEFAGDELIPATIQFVFAFIYGSLATYVWRGSRSACVGLLVLLALDTLLLVLRIGRIDVQLAVHVVAVILAIGGARGVFACADRTAAQQ